MKTIICTTCDGSGETTHNVGHHNTEYVTETCATCKGSGRLLTNSYSYTIPYLKDNNRDALYKMDSLIHEIIRKLEGSFKNQTNGNTTE